MAWASLRMKKRELTFEVAKCVRSAPPAYRGSVHAHVDDKGAVELIRVPKNTTSTVASCVIEAIDRHVEPRGPIANEGVRPGAGEIVIRVCPRVAALSGRANTAR